MKTYNQMSEDIDARRSELASRQRDRSSSFTQRSRAEMDRKGGGASTTSGKSSEGGSAFGDELKSAADKDVRKVAKGIMSAPGKAVRAAIERRKKAKAEKASAAGKKNEVKRAPFKPKRASKGVPFQPKTSGDKKPQSTAITKRPTQ